MILLPRPYPDEVIGSVLARGARWLGLSWGRLLYLATGRSGSSVPFLMPFALGRLAQSTGTDPEYLLERHTLFPYAVAFMSLARRDEFKARALSDENLCGLDALGHVVLARTSYRRVCPRCIEEDLHTRGETYWRRSHLLPGVHVCLVHGTKLWRGTLPLQHGRDTGDALLPAEVRVHPVTPALPEEVLESIALYSVGAMLRKPTDRNWLERYTVAAFALGYRLRSRAVAARVIARDLKRFFGDRFLQSMGASVDLQQKSPWPALFVRPGYPTRLAAPKHVLMLTFFEHAPPLEGLTDAPYDPPGPRRRDYRVVDAEALHRMQAFLQTHAAKGQRLTVRSLVEASGEQPCMKRFRDRFPRSLRFLAGFRLSEHAARRIRFPGSARRTHRQ